MNKLLLLLAFLIIFPLISAQNAQITEETTAILTYPFSDPNPIPLLAERNSMIYPYHSFDGYSEIGQLKNWKVVKLENDFIIVYILPEVGGKIWGAIEKSTGKEFIYRNEVVKFRNISLRGPWTSGGIEYNLGIIGHTPSTATPVDYITRTNSDGSVSCIVGNIDLPSRTQWRIEIRLPKDKAYFETIPLWNNPTPISQSYYCYMTGAAVVSDDLEFFYPGNQSLEHEGLNKPWPVDKKGHLLSIYPNNAFGSHTSIHVVGDYNDFMGGYYHKSEFGFGHWALYDDMPGRKLWLWALSREGEIWKDLLTDTDGQYMEFQAGRTFNQYSQSAFRSPIKEMPFYPGLTDQWKEIWFPVKEIGGIQEVSPQGVLNLSWESGNLRIGINALAYVKANLIVKSNEKIIFTELKNMKPMDVSISTIPLEEDTDFEVIVDGMDLRVKSDKKNLIKRPFATLIPPDSASAAGMYMQGIELKENRKYGPAKKYFEKCLAKDPLYIDAMSALTELLYRSSQYDSALFYANEALQLDAYDPSANYYAGVCYLSKKDFINALETFGWAARSPEFRSVAYAQMAGIEYQLKNYELAEHYANESLIYNSQNFNALYVLTVTYRMSGKDEKSKEILNQISSLDPINHFADFELYLLNPSNENLSKFKDKIKNEFPYQTYLEVAISYFNLGMKVDALKVLEYAPIHPLISIWKAYISNNPALLAGVERNSPEFVFPYRTETIEALKWAVIKSNNWRYRYFLGLNYLAIQRHEEAVQMFKSCAQDPDYAIFYLTRAYLVQNLDVKQELSDIQKANKLEPENWRTWSKLIDFYLNSGENKLALKYSTEATSKFKENFNLGLQHARAQLNNELYSNCIKTLEKLRIIPFEGSVQGKYVYEQAYLNFAIDLIQNKKYQSALEKIEKSKDWPENLGVGKPYVPDNRTQNYLEAICLEKTGKKKEAEELKNAIVEFTDMHYNDQKPGFNNLLCLWILQQRNETADANALIIKIKEMPQYNNSVYRYIVASFNNDTIVCKDLETSLSKNNYYRLLKRIECLNQ